MASTAGSGSSRAALLVIALPLLSLPGVGLGGDWKWTPRLTLEERYSDNVTLRPKGLEKSDWITQISPGIGVQREGRRLRVDVDYSLDGYLYANDNDRSRARSNLNGQARAELLQDWFYLDASARASQQLVDYVGGYGLGDAVGIQNTRQTYGYSLSPYLKHRFGSDATVEFRVGRDEYRSTGGGFSDSSTNRYHFSAVSGNNFFPLSWNLSYDRRETDYQSLTDTDSEQASAHGRLQIQREFGLIGQAGMQKGNFPGATNRIRDFSYYGLGVYYTPGRRFSGEIAYNFSDSGNFVSGSVTLQPTLRTTLKASSAQRNFGRSHSLSLNHRTRKSSWGLIYQERLTSYDQLVFQKVFDLLDCGGGLFVMVPPDTSLPGCTPLSNAALASLTSIGLTAFLPVSLQQTYVNKGLTGLFSYTLRRASVSLSLFDTRQEYQGTGALGREDRRTGLQAALSVRPGERTTLTLSTGVSHLEVDDPNNAGNNRKDDFWNIGLTLTRRFQPDVSGSLELRHQQRDSNLSNQDYTENAVAARLNMRF